MIVFLLEELANRHKVRERLHKLGVVLIELFKITVAEFTRPFSHLYSPPQNPMLITRGCGLKGSMQLILQL